ncbi:NALCN channel auxiliary factor 2 [Hetaerina americana]|uniref:NALCN channel auxiliary factor 2 n=1 Tax=Hetaerina americana TaxID=62018 RepID=UPI003A7F3F5C
MAPGGGRRRRGRPDDDYPHHRGSTSTTTTGGNHGQRRHHRPRRREKRSPRTAWGRAFAFGHQGHQPPVRDLLQRWRRCLASLLFFTVLLTEHAGGALAAEDLGGGGPPVASPPPPRPPEALSAAAAVQQVAPTATSNTTPTATPPSPSPPPDPPPPHTRTPPSSPPTAPPPGARGPPPPDLSDVDNRTCAGAARDVWEPPPSEAVVDYECPAPCAAPGGGRADSSGGSANQTTTQCLYYLEEMAQGEAACAEGEGRLKALHLKHCCESSVWSALPPEARGGGTEICTASVRSILEADDLSRRITCEFDNVLDRYDCGQVYSVRFGCDNCKAAYRRWVCSSLLPLFAESPPPLRPRRPQPPPPEEHHPPRPADGERVWPCRGVCHTVEQRCPFVLPGDRVPGHPTQYAGEPSFICQDPNIPEIEVQLENSAYGDHRRCCYTHCPSPTAPGVPLSAFAPSPTSSDFLLPAGDRAVMNNGRGVCFHCLRGWGVHHPRSITPGGRSAAAGDGGTPRSAPATPSGGSTPRPARGAHCWRLLVLQGLLLCLARRTSSLSFLYEYTL